MQSVDTQNRRHKDRLTGLYSRAGLTHAGESMLSRAARRHENIAALYIAVNEFEKFRAEQGEAAKKRLLRELGSVLKRNTRGSDLLARLHADEFVLFIADTHLDSFALIHRLQQEIDESLSRLGYNVRITVGGLTYSSCPDSIQQIISSAENALASLKRQPLKG